MPKTQPIVAACQDRTASLSLVSSSPNQQRWTSLAAGLLTVAGVVTACSGPTPAPTPTAPTPRSTETEPGGPGSLPQLKVGAKEGQYGANPPLVQDGEVIAAVPENAPRADRYRSEVYWESSAGAPLRVYEGDRLRCELTVTPQLGASAADPDQWQIVWQLHGPEKNGFWPQPPLNLHVRGETWRVGGGGGRDGGQESYFKPFSPYIDGKTVTWRFDVLVSENPARATVNAWLDGDLVVRDWHPPSGTRYPEHDYLTVKTGLYAGVTGTDIASDQAREVISEPLRCSVTRSDGSAGGTATTSPGDDRSG